jgi:lysophospholipid acyltransferase (LPLAT)-like uncharacterized protein
MARLLDTMAEAVRSYASPLHWVWVTVSAVVLCAYAYLVALTMRLTTTGVLKWPEVPVPCVLAVWHGCVPSLIAAVVARRPPAGCAIMIARDPRGDALALFCRLLRLRVVRGDSKEGGWVALARLVGEIERGACVLITADGIGPARIAKVGVVALSAATSAPIVTVGADCRPPIVQRRKWDAARNPLPFGRVAITLGESRRFPVFDNLEAIGRARLWLRRALNAATTEAKRALEGRA